MSTRILIVDDHPLLRRGISQLVEMEPGLEMAGEAASGEEALSLARELQPDIILLDLNMRGMTGVETLRTLREENSEVCVIVLTVSDSDEDITACLRSGANGYLLKDREPEELVASIRRAADGEIVISEGLGPSLARALTREHRDQGPDIQSLTAREREILTHLARGESNKAIARKLEITEATTKVHVKNLLRKMQMRSRVEAAVWAVQNGLS